MKLLLVFILECVLHLLELSGWSLRLGGFIIILVIIIILLNMMVWMHPPAQKVPAVVARSWTGVTRGGMTLYKLCCLSSSSCRSQQPLWEPKLSAMQPVGAILFLCCCALLALVTCEGRYFSPTAFWHCFSLLTSASAVLAVMSLYFVRLENHIASSSVALPVKSQCLQNLGKTTHAQTFCLWS